MQHGTVQQGSRKRETGQRDMEGKQQKVFKVGFFKKLSRHSWRFKFYWSSLRWKRVHLPVSFMHDLAFKIVSLFEAIVLVLSLCLFYLFFGCHF